MMEVSVIIVNYKVKELTCETIRSLISFTELVSYEIIVADNSPEERLDLDLVSNFNGKVLYLPMLRNIGFGGANNAALKIANGEKIMFLNPDTKLNGNVVLALRNYLELDPATGMVSCNQVGRDGNPGYSFRRFLPSVWWELNDFFSCLPERIIYGKNAQFNFTKAAIDIAYPTGAVMMVPLSILRETNGFDPSFFLYFEETDLALRIKELGYRVINIPFVFILHFEGESFKNIEGRESCYLKSKIQYFRKNLTFFERSAAIFILLITIYSRIIGFSLLFRREQTKKWMTTRRILTNVLKEK
jgi:GT2 family glycosyltransferase